MSEFEFVRAFVDNYLKTNGTNSAYCPDRSNQDKYPDCEIYYNGECVFVECKTFFDSRSNSNKFYNLLGEIIGLDMKTGKLERKKSAKKAMVKGVLIQEQDKDIYINYWKKNISNKAKKVICESLGLKYLIIYDLEMNKYKIEKHPQK